MIKAFLESSHASSEMVNTNGISVILPAFNEEGGIHVVLQDLLSVLGEFELPFEIVVVDDGSEDDTAGVAREYTGVRVFRHKGNRGYGAALKSGIRHANYDVICIIDADGTYPCNSIPVLLDGIFERNFDMVVGARLGKESQIPPVRRPAKFIISKIAQMVVNEPIHDLNSGLRIFKRSDVMQFFNILPEGFSFTTTITLGMLTNGYLVEYLPIEYRARVGKSKIRPIRDTINFFQLIFRIALYFAPIKIFIPMSAFVFIVGVAWALFSSLFLGRLADASTAVIMMSAVQIAVVGLLAELINHRLPGYQKRDSLSSK
jgi:glycosyltransferase involved in cell wall biosynthesis